MTLGFPGVKVAVRDLLNADSGKILSLRIPENSLASLLVSDRSICSASPVRLGVKRAARLGEIILQPTPTVPNMKRRKVQ